MRGVYSLSGLASYPQDLTTYRSSEIRVKTFPITLKFDRQLGSCRDAC